MKGIEDVGLDEQETNFKAEKVRKFLLKGGKNNDATGCLHVV